MADPKDYHKFPEPGLVAAGRNNPEQASRPISIVAKLWRPVNARLEEALAATLARFAHRLVGADGQAYTIEDILGAGPGVYVTGVDVNGLVDATSAIDSAISKAVATNRELILPRGILKCNVTIPNASGNLRIRGAGGGMMGDWTGVEATPATMLIPNNDALPVITSQFLRGLTLSHFEIRGNGAGVSADGLLVDHPSQTFAGNGLYCTQLTIRRFTNNFRSVGGCNVHFKDCGLFNANVNILVPNLPLAHSYTFDQCSLGGVATNGGGSGTSRILQVADGSFFLFANCEMGNCTDMFFLDSTGAPIVNIVGGNMETMGTTGSVLNTVKGGTFNMRGTRIGTGDRVVCRADGNQTNIIGISIEDNQAQGSMTLYDHWGFPNARLSGNGFNKTVKTYSDATFVTVTGTSVCEPLKVSARLTADQVLSGSTTSTVIFNQEDFDIGAKHNPSTGEYIPGKQTYLEISANLRLSGLSTNAILGVYINGSLRKTLGQASTAGGVTMVNGSGIISVGASDIVTVRLQLGAGGLTVQTMDNYSSVLSITEIPYFN